MGEPLLTVTAAWAIQNEIGPQLDHHPECSSVPGWSAISGPGLLCDCGAVVGEWTRRRRASGSPAETGEDDTDG